MTILIRATYEQTFLVTHSHFNLIKQQSDRQAD